jgi:uncharacterized protein (DUF608 family)
MSDRLFETDLPALAWREFEAVGFSGLVSGVIFRPDAPPCCGAPLGGIATGCVDIDVRGVLGLESLFNLLHPEIGFAGERGNTFIAPLTRKLPSYEPFLGLATGGKTWVLAARSILEGGLVDTCVDPVFIARRDSVELAPVVGVAAAQEIHYWGHYPVIDIEYELENGGTEPAPMSAGLRAWAPFVPGDVEASSTPCAFFEVHVRNESDVVQGVTLAFSFPGPVPPGFEGEIGRSGHPSTRASDWPPIPGLPGGVTRRLFRRDGLRALEVSDGTRGYALGVLDGRGARFGGSLGRNGDAWAAIERALPDPAPDARGTSVAVDLVLGPNENTVVRLVLGWYAPDWQGRRENRYTAMYRKRFGSAGEVGEWAVPRYQELLRRVLSWQEVIFAEAGLPPWLRDVLINNLALIPETTYWAVAEPPLGEWCYDDGFFGMLESPRGCPQIECNPCTFYGNLPIVFFFPELARSQLEGYRHYQREDGAAPFLIGSWGPPDMASPSWNWQVSLNGPVYAVLVDRLWQRTGDDAVLRAFYPSVKQNAVFTMNLRATPEGPISMPAENVGMEWFEWGEWLGMCAHLGGIRLAALRIVERMAEAVGDTEFAGRCRAWLADGSRAMEEKMWAGGYYLNYYEEESGLKSEVVMGYQLDGEWVAECHGVRGVFRPDRVPVVLDTIRRCNVPPVVCGALSFATREGEPVAPGEKIVAYGSDFIFLPEIMMLAMSYMYSGRHDYGLAFLHRAMEEMVCVQRHPWDLPNMLLGASGQRHFGTDYYQNMMLWAVPAALAGQDIASFCAPGGLVDRIIKAGS